LLSETDKEVKGVVKEVKFQDRDEVGSVNENPADYLRTIPAKAESWSSIRVLSYPRLTAFELSAFQTSDFLISGATTHKLYIPSQANLPVGPSASFHHRVLIQ